MSTEEAFFVQIGNTLEGSIQGKLFGKPCFKRLNKKAFVCFFENSMVFKLEGEDHREALNLAGSKLFDPSGKNRPMKAWVQIPYIHKEQWLKFAKCAAVFVET